MGEETGSRGVIIAHKSAEPWFLLGALIVGLVKSYLGCADQLTWVQEVAPIFIALPILIFTARRFPLTPMLYRLIFLHMLVLMIGGHYTYAKVPLGFWMEDWFGFTRNNYDRIGHFMQGFVPAIAAREILLRTTSLQRGKMLSYIVLSICLGFSAFYELLEWTSALSLGQAADAFLGTQGDPWDTQEDMAMALVGAICALVFFSRLHDRQMKLVSA